MISGGIEVNEIAQIRLILEAKFGESSKYLLKNYKQGM